MAPLYTDEEVGLGAPAALQPQPVDDNLQTDAEVGITEAAPPSSWLSRQKTSPKTMGKAFMQGVEAGVGAVLQGAGALNTMGGGMTVVGALNQLNRAAQGKPADFTPPVLNKSPLEIIQQVQENQIVQAGEAVTEDAAKRWVIPEAHKEALLTKGAEMAGGFVPLIASGPAAPATIALQSFGSRITNDFKQALEQGVDPETAARQSIIKASASGIAQGTIFAMLPKPLRSVVDKWFIDKLGVEGAKRFLAGRGAQAIEGFVLGAASIGAENVISGEPITKDLVAGSLGMAAPMLVMPHGKTKWEGQKITGPIKRRIALADFYPVKEYPPQIPPTESRVKTPTEPTGPSVEPVDNANFRRSKKVASSVFRTRGISEDVGNSVFNATGPKFEKETDENYRQRLMAVHDRSGFKVVGEASPFQNAETIRAAAEQEGWSESEIQQAIAEAQKQRRSAEQADYENNQRILRQGVKPAIETPPPTIEKGAEQNAPINVRDESVRNQQQYTGIPRREDIPPYPPEVRQEAGAGPGNRGGIVESGQVPPPETPRESPGLMPESAKPIDWRTELNATIENLRKQIPLREELSGAMAQVRQPLVDDAFEKTKAAWEAVYRESDPFKKIELQSIARKADDEAVRFFSKEQKSEIFEKMRNGEASVQAAWENQNQVAVPDDAAAVQLRSLKDPRRYRIISPSTYPDQKGKWQVSDFDERGAVGHFNADTLRDAISTLSGNWVKGIGSPWGSVGDFKVEKVIRKPKAPPTPERKGPIFDDTYKGERFRYGLQYRPLGFAQVPNDWIIGSDRPDPRFKNFGTVEWPRKLTPEEVESFQLVDLTGESKPKGGDLNAKEERLQGTQEVANVPVAGSAEAQPITVRTAAEGEASLPRSIDEQKGSAMTVGEGEGVKVIPRTSAELAKLLQKAKTIEAKAKVQYELKKNSGNTTVKAELRFKWRNAKLKVQELRNQLKAAKQDETGPKQVTLKAERTADVGGERPPDIIDDFRGVVGGKLSLDSAAEYLEDISNRLLAGGVLRKLFTRKGGMAIDDALDALHREGLYLRIDTETQFLEALLDAAQGRKGIKTQKTVEEKAREKAQAESADFAEAAYNKRKNTEEWKVNLLLEGDTFKLRDENFVVEDLIVDEESGELVYVRVKDGKRFGIKTIGGDDVIFADEGTVKDAQGNPKKEPTVEETWNVEEPSTTPVPAAQPEVPPLAQAGNVAPTEQPPVESVPEGRAAKAPEPSRPAGNVDLFGEAKGLNKQQQADFEDLSIKIRAARERGGEQLTPDEAKYYDELTKLAGQGDLFAAPTDTGVVARLAQLKAKREEMWRQRDLAVRNYQKSKIGSKFAGDIAQWTKEIDKVQKQIKELEAQAQELPVQPAKPVEAPKPPETVPNELVAKGDEINWEPNEARKKKYGEIGVRGIVQDVIRNQDGEIGFNIFTPTPTDPSRVVRVWSDRGSVISRKPYSVEERPAGKQAKPEGVGASGIERRTKTAVEIADEIAAQGVDPQASYGLFVKARDLKPEIDAVEWLPIYRKSLELARLNRAIELEKQLKQQATIPTTEKPAGAPIGSRVSRAGYKWEKRADGWWALPSTLGGSLELKILPEREGWLEKQIVKPDKGVTVSKPSAEKPAPAPKPTFEGNAPDGAKVGKYQKKAGRWYSVNEDGTLGKIPTNKKQHDQLEAQYGTPAAPEDTRSPIEILSKSARVSVKLPEGATILRGYDARGRWSDLFIADVNKGKNDFRDAGIVKIEAGFINREKKFTPIKGDIVVKERKAQKEMAEPTSSEPDRVIAEAKGPQDFIALLNRPNAKIPEADRALLQEFFRRPTIQKLDGLRFAIVEAIKSGFVGDYDPRSRLARFMNAESGIHETLHDLWYFISPDHRLEYIELRKKAIADAMKDLPRNYAEIAALERLLKEPMSSEEFIAAKMPRGLYYLANEREFFVASNQHRFLRDVMRPEAKGLVAKTKAIIQELWDWLKSKVGIGDRRDALYRKILKGDYEIKPEDGARAEAMEIEGSLARTPTEIRKQRAFDVPNVEGRVLGAYAEPVKLKMELADRLGLSAAARRMIRLPREAEMYAMAASELKGIDTYIEARDATPKDSPHLRWGVTDDAIHSITFQEELARTTLSKYQKQLAKVESPSFQKRISREAQLALRADLAKEKEETFRNVIATKAAALEAQIMRERGDSARVETLREDLRLTRDLMDWTMAISQQMDNIVNATYREFTSFGRGGYWTRWRENATGPKNGEEFFRLYNAARRAQGNPLIERQEIALARLASDILGINYELTNKLMWSERWRTEPDFAKAVQELGATFVRELQQDPAKAIRRMISREGNLASKAEQAKAAYMAINREVMRELEKLGDLEQAADVMKQVTNSDQWRNLVNTVYTDAEGMHIPDSVRNALRSKDEKTRYSSMFNEFTGKLLRVDPTGKFHEIELGWTPNDAIEAQKKLDVYLRAVEDWMFNPEIPANHPDRAYWQEQADFIRAVYKSSAVFDPFEVKSAFVRHSLGMPEFLFRQVKLPAVRVTQDTFENYERANNQGKQWSVGFDQDNMALIVKAAKAHGYDPNSQIENYRQDIFASLAWHYRHGQAIKPGQKLYGIKILKEDIDVLKYQGLGLWNLIKRDMKLAGTGRGAKMQDPRLVDHYMASAFLARSPQEFGAEHGTTVTRDFSRRGAWFAKSVATLKDPTDLNKIMEVLNMEEHFKPVVWKWIAERDPDYNADTGFEPLLKQLKQKIHEGADDAPQTIEDVLDFINRNSDASPEQIKAAIVGNIAKEANRYYNQFLKTEEGRKMTVRVIRATSEGPFNTAFEHDIGNSFFYDYGMFSTHEVRSAALDAAGFHLERMEISLRHLLDSYDRALDEFQKTLPNSAERAALKAKNKGLFRTGDDFRDFSLLQKQRTEIAWFIENLPIWSGRGVTRFEGLNTLFRIIGDSVVSKLAGWKTLARVFSGSAVKQGFVFSAFERFNAISYLKSAMSMAMSAYNIGVKGPAVVAGRRLGLVKKSDQEFSGILEEIFRQGKYFDQLYAMGMGTKTPLLNTIKNNLTMPYAHGRGFDPKLSGNAGIRLLQKAGYRALALAEAPLEVAHNIFPTLGYSIAYDSVARQAFNAIKMVESAARASFDLRERAGTLGKFNFKNPRSPMNSYALRAGDILPRGLIPKTETELAQAREMFKRGTDVDLKDLVLEFWAKLAETPKDKRGEVSLLGASGKTPEESAKLVRDRSLALASIGLLDIHHAGMTNRMWSMRGSFMWRTFQPIAGWTFQSSRQMLALFGKSGTDPGMRRGMATALTAISVLAGLTAMAIGGDAEKRMFDELEWIINKRVDPVRYFGMGRDAKENAIIATTGIFTYITVLSGFLERLLSEKGNRTSVSDQMFAISMANSMIRYISGVIHTGDPTYGLSGFVTREVPALKPLIRRAEANEGLTNAENAITAIQRFAPKDLIRQSTGGFGMPTPTELSVPKNKFKNAIYAGDSDGVVRYYSEMQEAAVKLGRTEPLRLVADIARSLNPYTLALIGHPTDTQRQELLSRLSDRERQVVLDAETNYLAAAQLVGVQSQMTRENRGAGSGGITSYSPSLGSGSTYAAPYVAGGGGGGAPGLLRGGGGAGISPRRISLGGIGAGGAFRRAVGGRATLPRLRISAGKTARKRFTRGRLAIRSGKVRRLGYKSHFAGKRRLSLRV